MKCLTFAAEPIPHIDMKPTISKPLLITAVLLAGSLFTIVADSNNGSYTQRSIKLQPRGNTSSRPKAPSMQSVSCTYSDGNLYFEFAIPEGECQLILSDSSTGEIVVEYFDSAVSEPVYVGYHRTASLTVDTENGKTYTGSW